MDLADASFSALKHEHQQSDLKRAVLHYWFGPKPPAVFSLPEQIALELSVQILTLEVEPGARILEQDIARHFCVSRGPVREALRILEREKLISVNARKGCTITTLSRQEVLDLSEARIALSALASRQLAHERSKAATDIIDSLLEVGAKAGEQGRYVEVVFEHGLQMLEILANAIISRLIASFALQTMRYSRLGLGSKERVEESLHLWRMERQAIANGDADAAVRAAVTRIERSRDEVLRRLAE